MLGSVALNPPKPGISSTSIASADLGSDATRPADEVLGDGSATVEAEILFKKLSTSAEAADVDSDAIN
jgi:hypothetical protein